MLVKTRAAVAKFRKAIVAAIAVVVVPLLTKVGVDVDNDTVSVLIDAALVSGLVWLVPNAKPYVEDVA